MTQVTVDNIFCLYALGEPLEWKNQLYTCVLELRRGHFVPRVRHFSMCGSYIILLFTI